MADEVGKSNQNETTAGNKFQSENNPIDTPNLIDIFNAINENNTLLKERRYSHRL